VLSAPPAFVLSQDQTLRLNPQTPSQSLARPQPGTREDPGTFYTGRKQIQPSTTQALAHPNSKQRTYPRLPEDAQTAKTPPAHPLSTITNLSKEQANGPHLRLHTSDPFGGAMDDRRGGSDM
jgi:hypothetical protein